MIFVVNLLRRWYFCITDKLLHNAMTLQCKLRDGDKCQLRANIVHNTSDSDSMLKRRLAAILTFDSRVTTASQSLRMINPWFHDRMSIHSLVIAHPVP